MTFWWFHYKAFIILERNGNWNPTNTCAACFCVTKHRMTFIYLAWILIRFQMGYKDGVHDGRESKFQKGFDDGYEQGFTNGFLLGKYKGILASSDTGAQSNIQNDLILQRPSRGQCILCTNPSLKDDSISDIIDKQTEHMKRIESNLSSRYVIVS